MDKDFKYINKENYTDFVIGMSDKVDEVIQDPIVRAFFVRAPKAIEDRPIEDTLKLAESFLHLMVDHEEYEICQEIINNYPELRTTNC